MPVEHQHGSDDAACASPRGDATGVSSATTRRGRIERRPQGWSPSRDGQRHLRTTRAEGHRSSGSSDGAAGRPRVGAIERPSREARHQSARPTIGTVPGFHEGNHLAVSTALKYAPRTSADCAHAVKYLRRGRQIQRLPSPCFHSLRPGIVGYRTVARRRINSERPPHFTIARSMPCAQGTAIW